MLTLNEIRNVNFRKSNFGGYRAEDVEAFIDEVQLSYDALLRENAELVKKLEVLASRIAEYQQEEEAIRNALMNAQKVADASLRDAKHKSEIMLKDATIKAERIVSNAQTEIHREREIIDRMQKDIADFKARLLKAYKDHLTIINNLPTGEILSAETRDMADSVVMLDRKASVPFNQQSENNAAPAPQNEEMRRSASPEQRTQRQPMPAPRIVEPQPADKEEPSGAPIPPANEKPQRKDGFTVNIGDEGPSRGAPNMRKPRFQDFEAPNGAQAEQESPAAAPQSGFESPESDSSPASLFRRRG